MNNAQKTFLRAISKMKGSAGQSSTNMYKDIKVQWKILP
jgi:hypothetical protein